MNIESLKTFLVVAEVKNLRKASAILYLSLSTISSRIQNLEEEVGKQLFDRSNKSLVLTQAGERIIPYAQNIITLSENLIDSIRHSDSDKQHLRIGISHSIYENFLKYYIPHFSMTHPNFNISFTHKASTLLLAELEQDKIDICISYQSLLDQNHKCFLIGDEQLILVTGILDTPYLDGITREELLSLPLFGSDICLVSRELVDWHDSTFPKDQNFSIHTSVTWDLVYLIRQGAGYAFLPRSFVAHDLEDHSLIEIPLLFSPPPRICTYLVIKNQHFGDLKLQEFLSDLKEHLHILHSSPAQM